jgi:hypothetical protein
LDASILHRENMNEGKSDTWFAYGAKLSKEHNLVFDYIAKSDTDTLPKLDETIDFVNVHLPPSPYNNAILAGEFVDKMWWKGVTAQKEIEQRIVDKYSWIIHLYTKGQFYFLSTDLAEGVGNEAAYKIEDPAYSIHHEDHDVSTMAVLSNDYDPVNYVMVSPRNRFWDHPLKIKEMGLGNWTTHWDAECDRMQAVLDGRAEPSKIRKQASNSTEHVPSTVG